MKQRIFNIIISIAVLALGISFAGHCKKEGKSKPPEIMEDTLIYKQDFYSKSPEEGLMDALIYYDIKHPHIVHAQAVIETGNFNSRLCVEDNNLFGLYNSRLRRYHKFDHWVESVEAYKKFIQYRYDSTEDYYRFLQRINYASDPEYINKVKSKVREPDDTRRSK